MTAISDPRPQPKKFPADIPIVRVRQEELKDFTNALRNSTARAIDTETVYHPDAFTEGPGQLRVISAATKFADGTETAWVIDANEISVESLATALSGITADAWNANFDSRVIDRDIFAAAKQFGLRVEPLHWWDAQLADALLYQGLSGFNFYHGLAWASESYLGIHAEGKGTTQLSYTADSVLTEQQVIYAASDAIQTMWVAEKIRARISHSSLDSICELEQRARPFLDQMERAGLPFNWETWQEELTAMELDRTSVVTQLAQMSGGGQASLFSESLEPSWNPSSEAQTKEALNVWATHYVRQWANEYIGEDRTLLPSDSLNASTLEQIGGGMCELLLRHRELSKVLSTYGDNIKTHLRSDGRLHPEYLQVVGTNTGRLASRNPNAQNFTPKMKSHIRPKEHDRVFIHADLSQAELRFVTQVASDTNMRAAFQKGIDIHEATAERMFQVDMAQLHDTDSLAFAEFRNKAKKINFGIVYGQRGAGLARSLTQSGVSTSTEEGTKLLDAYLAAYPDIASWLKVRDQHIEQLASSTLEIDWELTFKLHSMFGPIRAARRQFRDTYRRWPSAEELQIELRNRWELDEIAWTLSFHAPVVLNLQAEPYRFSSHTLAGRRQQFTLHTEGVIERAATRLMQSDKIGPKQVKDKVLSQYQISHAPSGSEHSEAETKRLLENRSLRRSLVEEVRESMGADAWTLLLDHALREGIRRLANAYRNAPIQGGVADIMLDAYGQLYEKLQIFDRAVGVQTVHDSVVIECSRSESVQVGQLVKSTLEKSMARWCPDVTPLADTDIRVSLSEKDIISEIVS